MTEQIELRLATSEDDIEHYTTQMIKQNTPEVNRIEKREERREIILEQKVIKLGKAIELSLRLHNDILPLRPR